MPKVVLYTTYSQKPMYFRDKVIAMESAQRNYQSNTPMEDIERDRPMSWYHSALEADLQSLDDKARLISSKIEGRVLLDVGDDLMQNFLDLHQDHSNDRQMQMEISDLKAKLNTALAQKAPPPSACLKKAQRDLQKQISINKEQHAAMQKIQAELSAERSCLAVAKTNVELELESFLTIERAQTQNLQQELSKVEAALQQQVEETKKALEKPQAPEDMESVRDFCVAKINEHTEAISKLMADLQKAEQELKTERLQAIEERSSLTAQIDVQAAETSRIAAALKKSEELQLQCQEEKSTLQKNFEEQLASDRLVSQQKRASLVKQHTKDKASYQAQLHKQEQRYKLTVASIAKAEQQHKSDQGEKLSLAATLKEVRVKYLDQLKFVASLRTQQEEATKILQVQLDEQKVATSRITADLKKSEDLLETQSLRFQEKSLLLQQLEQSQNNHVAKQKMQDEDHNNFVAALQKNLESDRLVWLEERASLEKQNLKDKASYKAQLKSDQEEKSSLLLATESLRQALQEKEEELNNTESSLRSQLDEAQSQIQKKKKMSWIKKLFTGHRH